MVLAVITWNISNAHLVQFEIESAGQNTYVYVPLLISINRFIVHHDVIGTVDEWQ